MKRNFKNLANYKYFESLIDLKSQRTIQLTYLILTIIALIFFGVFAINPTLSTIAKLQKELSDNQFVDESLQRKISNLSSLQQSYSLLTADLPTINNSIPKTPIAPILVAQIQSIAKLAGITILSSQVFPVQLTAKGTNSEKFQTFTFIILGQGLNSNITSFIDGLSKMQRIISLDQVTLTKKADQGDILQISLRGSAYFKK